MARLIFLVSAASNSIHASPDELLREAERGDAKSQFKLGKIYLEGIGTPRNHVLAGRWLLKAAEQNHTESQYLIGLLYEHGIGEKQYNEEAVHWFKKAAESDFRSAKVKLAEHYFYGTGTPQNHAQSLRLLMEAGSAGDSAALFLAAEMKRIGFAEGRQVEAAKVLYGQASKLGYVKAMQRLAHLKIRDKSFRAEDLGLLRNAAESSDSEALLDLGLLYFTGIHVTENRLLASYHLKEALALGEIRAAYPLSLTYTDGNPAPPDDSRAAFNILRKASNSGDPDAAYGLALMMKDQSLRHPYQVVPYMREAAQLGNPSAQHYMSEWCANTSKESEAMEWLEKAAMQGHDKSQYQIGLRLISSRQVSESKVRGLAWLMVAEASGVKEAAALVAENTSGDVELTRKASESSNEILSTIEKFAIEKEKRNLEFRRYMKLYINDYFLK